MNSLILEKLSTHVNYDGLINIKKFFFIINDRGRFFNGIRERFFFAQLRIEN
jgi:hypothetical protein